MTACTSKGQVDTALEPSEPDRVWVGGIVANQTPEADKLALGLTADRYGMPLYRCLEKRDCQPYSGDVILTVRTPKGEIIVGSEGPMEVKLDNIGVKGWYYASFAEADLGKIVTGALLCVELDRPIAHQVQNPSFAGDRHIMCTDAIHDYFVKDGRGREKQDAWGVAAIGSAG